MKRAKYLVLTITMLLLLIGGQFVFAEDDSSFMIYNASLVTNDRDATYIEGSVSAAKGQTIVVKHALIKVAEKTLPDTGKEAAFRIKVPAKYISTSRLMVFTVKEMNAAGKKVLNSERVEVTCIEKKNQDIEVAQDKFELTFPGNETAIKAESTSGEKLVYSSSDSQVASVDENGVIETQGEGEAIITVKQIGNGEYEEIEKKVNISVKGIDAYTITYHSSDSENAEIKQIIRKDTKESLQENSFSNGKNGFLGWATSDEGLVEYSDGQEVENLAQTGNNIDMYAVWEGDGIRGAIAWAVNIANDDSFSYGKKPQTSKVGCYFCGTNQKNKPKGYEKTYVCLTFIHAAYAHGAGDPELLKDCMEGKHCITASDTNFSRYSCWKKVGKAKNLSVSDLQPGDVIVTYSPTGVSNGHVAMYIGGNQIVDAEGIKDCWGPDSIAVRNKAASALRGAAKHSGNSYVMRYVGPQGANG